MATASVTPSTGGRGSPGPQASRALWHFPRGAALRPATCPPPSRACARPLAPITESGAPRNSPARRAGPRSAPLARGGLVVKPHVPAPREGSRFCKASAPQSPCAPASRRCAARRLALSMRASRWPRRRLGPWLPGRQGSQLLLPVTYVPPCATPNAGGGRKVARLAAVGCRDQSQAHPGGRAARARAGYTAIAKYGCPQW